MPPRPTSSADDLPHAPAPVFALPPGNPTVTPAPTATSINNHALRRPDHPTRPIYWNKGLPTTAPHDVTSNDEPALSIAAISKICLVRAGNLLSDLFVHHMAPSPNRFHDPPADVPPAPVVSPAYPPDDPLLEPPADLPPEPVFTPAAPPDDPFLQSPAAVPPAPVVSAAVPHNIPAIPPLDPSPPSATIMHLPAPSVAIPTATTTTITPVPLPTILPASASTAPGPTHSTTTTTATIPTTHIRNITSGLSTSTGPTGPSSFSNPTLLTVFLYPPGRPPGDVLLRNYDTRNTPLTTKHDQDPALFSSDDSFHQPFLTNSFGWPLFRLATMDLRLHRSHLSLSNPALCLGLRGGVVRWTPIAFVTPMTWFDSAVRDSSVVTRLGRLS
jgi:hypothetical protein